MTKYYLLDYKILDTLMINTGDKLANTHTTLKVEKNELKKTKKFHSRTTYVTKLLLSSF